VLGATIGVRFKDEDKKLLEKICDARGEDVSDFIRRAIRRELAALSFLSEFEKKALQTKASIDKGDNDG
jgi:uncharacterized protein (DUF1778 family)